MSGSRPTRPLTNREQVILSFLRDHPGGLTVNSIADGIRETLLCPHCGGTGEGDCNYHGCCKCYGRGRQGFFYSDAYQPLKKLLRLGLVERVHLRDQFGDPLRTWLWVPAPQPNSDDPLEALYAAPSANAIRQ